MKRVIIVAASALFATSTANAAADLFEIRTNCGALEEVMADLVVNMPNPRAVSKGVNAHGEDVVVLFAGASYWGSYWALVTMFPRQACIVASGRTWEVLDEVVED